MVKFCALGPSGGVGRLDEATKFHVIPPSVVRIMPAYAPELNPVEPLWSHLDTTTLANTPLEDLRRLRRRVHTGLRYVRGHPGVTRGFLKYTGLF